MGNPLRICPECGTKVNNPLLNVCPHCGYNMENVEPLHKKDEDRQKEIQLISEQKQAEIPENNEKSMKWHRFVMKYLSLIFIIANLISGVLYCSGLMWDITLGEYNITAEFVYVMYDNIQLADLFYGLCLIFGAVLAMISRVHLKAMEKKGIGILLFMYIFMLSGTIIYMLLVIFIVGEYTVTLDLVCQSVSCLGFMVINSKYYKKRLSYFKD